MNEDRIVWVDRDLYPWPNMPNNSTAAQYGPFVKSKVVPADAIVIERGELPEAGLREPRGEFRRFYAGDVTWTPLAPDAPDPEVLERQARACLALAAYLREHPPEHMREVEALRSLLCMEGSLDPDEMAERLLATGRVHVDVEEGS